MSRRSAIKAMGDDGPSLGAPEVERVRDDLRQQARMIEAVASRLDERFAGAVDTLATIEGHVVVSGLGKSGHVARKIASTLSSTLTPAFFINAAEAAHGDLGAITGRDAALLVSHSGRTAEVLAMLPYLRSAGAPTIALVGRLDSPLAQQCDVVLDVSVQREACPHNLVPTTSSLVTLAVGDALALALARRKGFGPAQFAERHPGGRLGDKLARCVGDVMRRRGPSVQGRELPIVGPASTVADCLLTMTSGRLGLVLVMEGEELRGILTDGDLRRCLQRSGGRLDGLGVEQFMTSTPLTISEGASLRTAHELMVEKKVTALVVTDDVGSVSGVVQIFDVE